MGVDIEPLAGLGIFHDHRPDVGQLDLARVEQADGDHLVPSIQQVQRPFPSGNADEVGYEEDQGAALDDALPCSEQRLQVREWRVRQARLPKQVVDQAEDLVSPASRRDRPLDGAAVEDRTYAVAASGQQPSERRHEIGQDGSLQALGIHAAEVDRGTEVEEEPGGDLAVLDVLADVWRVHPGGDVPVDGANVVPGLVFAQVHQIHAVAAEKAPVVALQDPVEPADDLPVEALEDAFRDGRGSPRSGAGSRRSRGETRGR